MKFIVRSLFVLLLLYGLVFAIGDAYLLHSHAPLWVVLAFPVFWVAFQFLIAPWGIQMILDIRWDDAHTDLPVRNREFIEKLCAERGLKVPRIGIIESGTPNAFSFGRLRSDARVVVTSGLLKILTPEEANAVLAHEIGHIEHWDFAVMTLAALAPMLLYQFYVVTEKINNFRAIAYSAYLCYLVSQFIVLLLNRTREYFADHYAAEVTHAPDDLSSALVKIAYGMVRADGEYQKVMQGEDKEEKSRWGRERRLGGSLALMGISNLHSGKALALGANPVDAAAVMRWDLVNPWARFYELNSTHPLTALRVRELNRQGSATQQGNRYMLPQDLRLHWGTFPLELLVWGAPLLCIGALFTIWWFPGAFTYLGVTLPDRAVPGLLILAGFTWALRVAYRYRGKFQDATIGTLLEDVEVSQMRPRAVRLNGKILGRGEPGAFWSPDLVLRDSTGIMFILYQQSIPFARFVFGASEAESFVGQEVVVEGWFRRGMTPYVELSKLTGEYETVHRTYSRWIQLAVALAAMVAGWIWLQH
ncbi:MAG TPA: M48 family metalloprotease [Candidatus Angelobacter sp.]|nr:M48 family metalloprotease [Candidatus Angelobacter sp.]